VGVKAERMEINMSTNVERYLKRMLDVDGERIVKELSERYGFSEKEGLSHVMLNDVKVEIERKDRKSQVVSPKSKIPLPFCGTKIDENCDAIRLNHGLYTQCTNEFDITHTNGYHLCKTCSKQTEKNSNGNPTYGYITERIELGGSFRDPKGKVPVPYGNIMEKLNITRANAEKEAANIGLTIPEEQFEIKKARRGRPKKDVVTVDTSDDGDSEQQKPTRGRPKKNSKPTNTNVGEDIIKELVKSEGYTPVKSVDIQVDEPSNPQSDEPSNSKTDSGSNSSDESDEEELSVTEFKISGVKYLKAADNTLYNFKTHEEIGTWNPKTKEIENDD